MATSAITIVALAGLILFLWRLGLGQADQLASVVGLFIGLTSLVIALLGVAQARQASNRPGRVELRTAWGTMQLGDDIRQLLVAVQRAADTLPNPLLGERRTAVSTVYVRQRVEQPRQRPVRNRREERKRLFLPFDHEPRTIPMRQPFAKAFDLHRHLLLEGGPGSGKSTTARQICRELAAAWLEGDRAAVEMAPSPLLPVLISARGLADHIGVRWPEAVANALRAELGAVARLDVPPELLEAAVDGVPWLVVVDGLDEVPGEDRDALLDRLAAQTQDRDPAYRLLITTRPLAGHATGVLGSASVGHYTLVPFDGAALRDFARRWFTDPVDGTDEQEVGRFLNEIAAAGLQEVASVPLMATMAISVFAEGGSEPLPRNRYDLYEHFMELLRRTSYRRRQAAEAELTEALASEPEGRAVAQGLYGHLDDLLETLAVVRVTGRKPLLPAALDHLRRIGRPFGGSVPHDWGKRVVDALTTTGLVSRRDASIDFIHLSFAEHLAARVHAGELGDTLDPEGSGWQQWLSLNNRREQDALLVLAAWSRTHDAGELLDWLLRGLDGHRLLAARLVAEGTRATTAQLAGCLRALAADLAYFRRGRPATTTSMLLRFPETDQFRGWLHEQLDRAAGYPRGRACRHDGTDLRPASGLARRARAVAGGEGDAPACLRAQRGSAGGARRDAP